jgi:hypothetical protein
LVDRVLNHLLEVDRVRASKASNKTQHTKSIAYSCSDMP